MKAVRAGDTAAIARVSAVRRDRIADFGLMKAQHVVAVEVGFTSWAALIVALVPVLRELVAQMTQDAAPRSPQG
jgi:hypothetical protein